MERRRFTRCAPRCLWGDGMWPVSSAASGSGGYVSTRSHIPTAGSISALKINGRPIFLKGANFVPADLLFARLDRPRYNGAGGPGADGELQFPAGLGAAACTRAMTSTISATSAALSCGRNSIYACGKYPLQGRSFLRRSAARGRVPGAPAEFAAKPHRVVRQQRDRHVQTTGGYPNRVWSGPTTVFFHLTLRQIVHAEHPGCYYQPSSPYSPDGTLSPQPRRHWRSASVVHRFPRRGFSTVYRPMVCRFPQRGWFPSVPPSLPTVLSCLPEGQQTRRFYRVAIPRQRRGQLGRTQPGGTLSRSNGWDATFAA